LALYRWLSEAAYKGLRIHDSRFAMAKIEELIGEIADPRLRVEIAAEVKRLKVRKKFGLVFEEHLPETVRLPGFPVRAGELVAERGTPGNDLWLVVGVKGAKAQCRRTEGKYDAEHREFALANLVVVKRFGEAIYPALVPVDRVARGGVEKPWHVLINADNFHALQLLLYAYEGQVDMIYIDPPYNTGARDWKYNNDYVDKADSWRHSKWLSMMKKRLQMAKPLLKPDGVLVVTIDEHEVHHLGALLAQELPEFSRQMVTIVINQKGVAQGRLSRVEEYAFFCFGPDVSLSPQNNDLLALDRIEQTRFQTPRWEWLLRGGTNSRRQDRKKLFYPIFVDPNIPVITGFGEPLAFDEEPKLSKEDEKKVAWPFRGDGSLGNWRVSPATMREYVAKGYVKLGGYDPKRKTWTVLYLGRKAQKDIEAGTIIVTERDVKTGAVQIEYASGEQRQIKTVWHRGTHDAGNYGSTLIRTILGEGGLFSFPKSLYAVRDTLKIITSKRPDALILDFFGGSGTTLHATALLNAELGGKRRCILVTNNEVTEKLEKRLLDEGHFPGDSEFERHGVADSVGWPRCKFSIVGKRDDGTELAGEYLNGRPLAEGFEENIEYFKVEFLDPGAVAMGRQFEAILPLLWARAGCMGQRESSRGSTPWFIPKHSPFAVLIEERRFGAFKREVSRRSDLTHIFFVTDSEENFRAMTRALPRSLAGAETVQLYRSYLENFRINTELLAQP